MCSDLTIPPIDVDSDNSTSALHTYFIAPVDTESFDIEPVNKKGNNGAHSRCPSNPTKHGVIGSTPTTTAYQPKPGTYQRKEYPMYVARCLPTLTTLRQHPHPDKLSEPLSQSLTNPIFSGPTFQ